MKDQIIENLHQPAALEQLYRSNKQRFKKEFSALYPELKGSEIADCWNARLNFETETISWGSKTELLVVIACCIIAGFIAKIPAIFNIDEALFYPRNIGFILFPILAFYFAWKHHLQKSTVIFLAVCVAASLVFMNLLPRNPASDTLVLSCIHMVLCLWALLGIAFTAQGNKNPERRIAYLKYNGDLVVITTLIVIAGGILTGLTIGLFSLIGLQIEEFYFKNIVIFALPSAPIIGTYLIQANPSLVGKVSPIIAKIFSPLVLAMLIVYLAAIVYSGKNPYQDRDFLFIFNLLLIGVMAIIFFSIAGSKYPSKTRSETWILFLLSIVTIIINGVALSAILFRISTWGITPNRLAVLGGNLLILLHLLLVCAQLFKLLRKKRPLQHVENTIAGYLPVYVAWAAAVTFLFPLIFGFK